MEFNVGQIDLKQEASSRERIYFIIVLLLIAVAFARWLYIPKIKEIKMMHVQVKNQELQIDTLKQFAQLKIPESALQKVEAQTTTNRLQKIIEEGGHSKQQMVANVVGALTSQEALGEVNLTGIAMAADVDKDNYIIVPVTIDLKGSYTAVAHYLKKIERIEKLITADNIELITEESQPSLINAKITGSIYVVKQQTETP